jgi:hypothetical protein
MRMTSTRLQAAIALASLLLVADAAAAQDANITRPVAEIEQLLMAEPLVIVAAEISRPKAKGDITLRADVAFGDAPPLRVKLRRAEPGGEAFNNVPRYDLAAYELQKLFLDPAEYVVPPTVLRMVPLADFARYAPEAERTFPAADQVLAVAQYWLSDIKVIADIYDPQRFAGDPAYARHIGQLNIFTHLVNHRDSNAGNFLIGRAERGPRVFSIDHGVAFESIDGDRGKLWQPMRVDRLPADTVDRLRSITPAMLQERLGVLAQWRLQDGSYMPVEPGPNQWESRGVRRRGDQLQLGLTRDEISATYKRLAQLLKRIDAGELQRVPAPN